MRNEKPKCSMLKVEWIVRSFESACLPRPRSGPGPVGSEFEGRNN